MASRLGMAIREDQANQRIDAAVAALAGGSDVPDAPEPTRDPVLRSTLRLEWIADVLEALSAGESNEDLAATLSRHTRDDLNAEADRLGIDNPAGYRTKAELVDVIVATKDGTA